MHDPHSERMSSGETRAASGLALVFAFRMLGMFMVLPVLATYGMDLAGATPALIGLAIGAYGLTQALFNLPAGDWDGGERGIGCRTGSRSFARVSIWRSTMRAR